jgi:hypothetical protein
MARVGMNRSFWMCRIRTLAEAARSLRVWHHVAMHIDGVPNRTSRPTYLLRESYREGKKVRKRTLANLSALSDEQIDAIRAVLSDRRASRWRSCGRPRGRARTAPCRRCV